MYNDEIFQKIATTPGLNALELAEYFGRQKGVIYRNLIRLENMTSFTHGKNPALTLMVNQL